MTDFMTMLLAICAAITCVSGAATVIVNIVVKAQMPNKKQDERLDKVEAAIKRHDEQLANGVRRFKEISDGNQVTQRALLALLAHGIDGNEIEGMKKAKQDLQDYLTSR